MLAAFKTNTYPSSETALFATFHKKHLLLELDGVGSIREKKPCGGTALALAAVQMIIPLWQDDVDVICD